jgi:zinc protease
MNLKLVFLSALFLLIGACATQPTSVFKGTSTFQMRPYQEETLPNGLKILYVQDHSLPKVRVMALVRMGSEQDSAGLEGISSLTSRLIEDGTTHMSGPQLAEELAYLGAEYSSSTDHEKTFFSVSSLSANKDKTLNLFSRMLMSPAFSSKELQRRKSQVIAGLQKLTENPTGYADILLDESVYGSHPYGRLVSGSLTSVPKITRSDVMRQYFKFFRPNNAWLAVAGDFDETFKAKIRKSFGAWLGASVSPGPVLALKEMPPGAIRLVSKPGLPQSQIRMGSLGIKRQDPDFLKLKLASLILGGTFESRLNLKIRDELGLTYSISSGFDALREGGSFEISTFSRNDKAAEVIKQTHLVLNNFVSNGVTSKELEAAKTFLISQFPASVETPGEMAASLLRLRFYEIPDSYLSKFILNVSAITKSDVNEAIKKHFKPELLKTVVFSDQAQVAEGLKALGPVATEAIER